MTEKRGKMSRYSFGERSRANLHECDPLLQRVLVEALATGVMDFAIIEGHRPAFEQDQLFREGKTKARAGQSKHNSKPSLAADVMPWPAGANVWNDTPRWHRLAGVILACAAKESIPIRWGGDWDRDGDTSDNRFNDLPHFELT